MSAPRRQVDIRRLPHGLGYVMALAVVAFVIALAWLASREDPAAPEWWSRYASPAILWSSPILVLLLVIRYVDRMRRRRDPDTRR